MFLHQTKNISTNPNQDVTLAPLPQVWYSLLLNKYSLLRKNNSLVITNNHARARASLTAATATPGQSHQQNPDVSLASRPRCTRLQQVLHKSNQKLN